MKKIVQDGNPVLREKAKEVPLEDITSEKIASLIKDMREALKEKEFGVALAAPQIGESLRIFIVARKVFEEDKEKEKPEEKTEEKIEKNLLSISILRL